GNPLGSAHQRSGNCGADVVFGGFRTRSRSSTSFFVTFSATSAPAPRNFAPWLSCVVDHSTSPSRLTSRTATTASCLRSDVRTDSCSPAPPPTYTPRRGAFARFAGLLTLVALRLLTPSDDWNVSL